MTIQQKSHRLLDGIFKLLFFKFSVCSSISIALSNSSSVIIPQKNDPTWYALLRGVSGSVTISVDYYSAIKTGKEGYRRTNWQYKKATEIIGGLNHFNLVIISVCKMFFGEFIQLIKICKRANKITLAHIIVAE